MFMLIEIGELLHDDILCCSALFACAYVLGKLLDLIAYVIKSYYL